MKSKIIISWILVFLCMVFIFVMSSYNSSKSSSVSGGLIKTAVTVSYEVRKEKVPEEKKLNEIVENSQNVVRETAHGVEYFFLGLFLCNALLITFKNKKLYYVFIIGLLYAISDEIHQIFVPGRSCELKDLIIDMIGIGLSILIITLILRKKSKYSICKQ